MTMVMKQRRIAIGEFKSKCLGLIDELSRNGGELVITKRGKPIARVTPVSKEWPDAFGFMAGTVEITGDIVGPTGEEWDAERGEW